MIKQIIILFIFLCIIYFKHIQKTLQNERFTKYKTNTNIAIMIIGLKRSYNECKEQIDNNLLSPLIEKSKSVDVFISSDEIIDIKNKRGEMIENKNIDNNIDNNINMQIYRLHRLYYKIIKPYQKKNNIQYDYFIKIRPDFVFYRNCIPPIDKWNSKKISCRMRAYPNKIPRLYIPTFFDLGQEMIDDQFFIIPKYLEEYAFRIDYGNYPKKTTSNYAEAKQTKLWNSHNIKYELIYVNGTLNKWKNKF